MFIFGFILLISELTVTTVHYQTCKDLGFKGNIYPEGSINSDFKCSTYKGLYRFDKKK